MLKKKKKKEKILAKLKYRHPSVKIRNIIRRLLKEANQVCLQDKGYGNSKEKIELEDKKHH